VNISNNVGIVKRHLVLYGAKIPSCGWEILVNDAAETIAAQNAQIAASRYRRSWLARLRWRQQQRSMWPVPVVMIDEHMEDPLKVLLVQNQQPSEAF